MTSKAGIAAVDLICRIGSLESRDTRQDDAGRLICRIGSLEIPALHGTLSAQPYLPHRQLRKGHPPQVETRQAYLPHRQLRKLWEDEAVHRLAYLPHRQLRNLYQ